MRAIRGIVFDKDGTLFDFQATWGTWARGLVLAEARTAAQAAALAQALGVDMARAASAALPQVPAAPLVPLMAGLRARGLRLGLATNDTEGPARAHLAAAGIAGDFDFVAGFNSGWGGKPAPGQLLAFARAMGLETAECAMVGDSLHDLHAARAAGMVAVGVLTGLAGRAELAPAADAVLGSIAELPAWLDRADLVPV